MNDFIRIGDFYAKRDRVIYVAYISDASGIEVVFDNAQLVCLQRQFRGEKEARQAFEEFAEKNEIDFIRPATAAEIRAEELRAKRREQEERLRDTGVILDPMPTPREEQSGK